MIRVCEVSEFGGPEVLRSVERPSPEPGPGEALVRVGAANVNPSDLAARAGYIRRRLPELSPPFVPGWDFAGVIETGAGDFSVGDPVLGMVPWIHIAGARGAYAEALAAEPEWLAPRPEGVDEVAGATVPLNALTAHQALELVGGGTLLVTGASGAVGGFAVQLAVARGLRVLAVASAGDEEWVAGLGAAEVLPRSVDYARLPAVDAAIDAVPVGAAAAACVRPGGVAVFTRGVQVDRDDLEVHTPLVHPDAAALAKLAREVAAGRLRTRVARTFDLADAAEAHRLADRGGVRGKLVLRTRA